MNVMKYIGLPYDYRSKSGVNCWSLYVMVMKNEVGLDVLERTCNEKTAESAAASFTAGLINGIYKHKEVDKLDDFTLVIMEKRGVYHCGIYYKRKLLHAKGSGLKGQVWYESLDKYKNWNLRYYKYED